jgi:hypothetical protein
MNHGVICLQSLSVSTDHREAADARQILHISAGRVVVLEKPHAAGGDVVLREAIFVFRAKPKSEPKEKTNNPVVVESVVHDEAAD